MTDKKPATPETIDAYIAAASPEARPILEKIRAVVRAAAPDAEEVVSYRMPAFKQDGILVYFAAFKQHIGLFPPVRGDAALEAAAAPYAGEKGNLRFPLDEPIPYELIERIVRSRLAAEEAKKAARRKKKPTSAASR
jgi:uncharacterized protein YdhG (YjbR/CyaY superfamily)